MATKSKKMSNEGHGAKVPLGRSIGLVFVIGMIVGCIVVFLAVAGRTQGIVEQRKAEYQQKKAKEAEALKVGPDEAEPADRSEVPAPAETPSGGNVLP